MSQQTDPATPLFETIGIVGVGLIGGSIAAAVKARKLARTVIGAGRDHQRLEAARTRGLIDEITTDLRLAAGLADLLIFCTPVDRIVAGVREAADRCRTGTLITDAGSAKGSICRGLDGSLPAGIEFVGSHPLAGSEKQGFEHADARLFEGRVCVVTPVKSTAPEAVERVTRFWQSLGSVVLEMSPEDHDRALAETSHLPHVVATALASVLAPENRRLAATGFRDTTRIAAGDPDLWSAILLDNAGPISAGLARFDHSLARLRQAIEQGDRLALKEMLSVAKNNRDALNNNNT